MADPADRLYERVLVVRCQTGDAAAFAELVARHQPRLRAFLHKMVLGRHNVDDLAQDVWMDVFRGLPHLAEPGAFLPWMYRIAHHRAFRMMRRRPAPTASVEEIDVADESEDAGDFTAEDAAAVHAALDRLSPDHRAVLLLRFIEEMSYDDVARVVGCPVGTVRSRIHHAKRELRTILERQAARDRA